jgi:glyoxylate reductase
MVHQDAIDLLREHFAEVDVWESPLPPSREELVQRASGCIALITMLTEKVDHVLFDAAPDLKVVANVAVGYDNLDVPEARRRGIKLGNTPDVLTEATADLAFALLLGAARRVFETSQDARAGRWGPWHPQGWLGYDAHGRTLGIVGLGRIGAAVARRSTGFGMRVIYHARTQNIQAETELAATYYADLLSMLAEADFVSLHVPLTEETQHFIGKRELSAMKSTAIIINTSRGGIIDQEALVQALTEGTIAGAGLDVTTPEPLPKDDPLFTLPNAFITPHIGSASHASRRDMAVLAARNAIAACLGGSMPAGIIDG